MRHGGYGDMLERAAIEFIFRSGLSRLAIAGFGGRGAIYMFHSVEPNRLTRLTPGLTVSPAFLDRLLANLRRAEFDIIGIQEVAGRLAGSNPRRFVVATFDDGYADNLRHALPVFEKHGAPLTVYVTSGVVTRELYCWWAGLEHLFLRNETVEIDVMERKWTASTNAKKSAAYEAVSDWVSSDITARAPLLRNTFDRYGLSMPKIVGDIGLDFVQLRTLSAHPLVTIGGHTTSHPEISRLDPAEARREITENKNFLENIVQKPVDDFAYPYGGPTACGPRDARLVVSAGFKTAVTTAHGCVLDRSENRYLLPRVGISRRYESIALARTQIDGAVASLRQMSFANDARLLSTCLGPARPKGRQC